ncbi:spore coat protein, partial [Paenibacillus riograndensis]
PVSLCVPVPFARRSYNSGPDQFPGQLISLRISRALADQALPVYGDGMNIRDWLYVEDHCSAIDLVIHEGVNGEVYNSGGNNERTNVHIVKTVLQELGKPDSLITYVQDRPGHDRRYGIDPTKITRELGWKPKHTFETGIKETIQWYLNNQEWWTRIQSGEYQKYAELQYGSRLGDSL